MNNLQTMYNWLEANQNKIKPNFNIKHYRELLSDRKHECNSTGCLIGWGVGAFPIEEIPIGKRTEIDGTIISDTIVFNVFSEVVLGMYCYSNEWKFIFDSDWYITEYNSFDDAMSRYKHVLDGKPIEEHSQYKTFLKYVK